jgi:diadenosine tetraphosphate (Ap4A) HIT family hydrolase
MNDRLIELLQQINEFSGLPEDEFEELINLLEERAKQLRESFESQKNYDE